MTSDQSAVAVRPARRAHALALLRDERVPLVGLAAAMLLAFVLLYRKGFGLTFYYDEWNYVMNRRDWTLGTFLEPHNEHLTLVPVVIFKLLFVTVGLDDYWVYHVVLLALHLVCAALVFVLVRRRVDSYAALAAAILILFLGSAWNDLLVAFQISYLASTTAGLGMLLALEARRDALAAVLLGVALASSGIGLPFAAAALVEVAWRRQDRWRRLWVPLAPIGLYLAWSVVYGNPRAAPGAENGLWPLISLNIPAVPGYVANAVAGAFGGLTGLGIDWGRPLALLGVTALAVRFARGAPVNARLASLLAAGAVFWGLTALLRAHLNAPADSRYLYLGGVLLVLIGAELLAGARVTARAGAVLAVLVAVAAFANFGALRAGSASLQDTSAYVAAGLGALELVGRGVDPDYSPDPVRAPDITAARYFEAVEDHGSPADTPDEIAARPDQYRQRADSVLAEASGITARPVAGQAAADGRPVVEGAAYGGVTSRRSCVVFQPTAGGAALEIRASGSAVAVTTRGNSPVEVRLRAFAAAFPQAPYTSVPGRSTRLIVLTRPSGAPPWHIRLTPAEPVEVCGAAVA